MRIESPDPDWIRLGGGLRFPSAIVYSTNVIVLFE